MPEALAAVKRELGPDAVILGTRTLPATGFAGLARRLRVEISAAPAAPGAPPPRVRAAANPLALAPAQPPRVPPAKPEISSELYPYYVELVQREVAEDLAARIIARAAQAGPRVTADSVRTALRTTLAEMIPTPNGAAGADKCIALVGPAGGGKTSTAMKLALRLQIQDRKSVALISLDTQRIGAAIQLARYAELIDLPLRIVETPEQARAARVEFAGVDCVVVDTPGVTGGDAAAYTRLVGLLRVVNPTRTELVLPATLAPRAQARIAQAFAPLGATRLILTHLDEVVGLGAVLSAADRIRLTLSYISAGQSTPDDLEVPCPDRLATLICPAGN